MQCAHNAFTAILSLILRGEILNFIDIQSKEMIRNKFNFQICKRINSFIFKLFINKTQYCANYSKIEITVFNKIQNVSIRKLEITTYLNSIFEIYGIRTLILLNHNYLYEVYKLLVCILSLSLG